MTTSFIVFKFLPLTEKQDHNHLPAPLQTMTTAATSSSVTSCRYIFKPLICKFFFYTKHQTLTCLISLNLPALIQWSVGWWQLPFRGLSFIWSGSEFHKVVICGGFIISQFLRQCWWCGLVFNNSQFWWDCSWCLVVCKVHLNQTFLIIFWRQAFDPCPSRSGFRSRSIPFDFGSRCDKFK